MQRWLERRPRFGAEGALESLGLKSELILGLAETLGLGPSSLSCAPLPAPGLGFASSNYKLLLTSGYPRACTLRCSSGSVQAARLSPHVA